jgi:hypothetical protein
MFHAFAYNVSSSSGLSPCSKRKNHCSAARFCTTETCDLLRSLASKVCSWTPTFRRGRGPNLFVRYRSLSRIKSFPPTRLLPLVSCRCSSLPEEDLDFARRSPSSRRRDCCAMVLADSSRSGSQTLPVLTSFRHACIALRASPTAKPMLAFAREFQLCTCRVSLL